MSSISSVALQSAVTTTATGTAHAGIKGFRTYQANGTTTAGAGAATILIEVSNVPVPATGDWITLATITLTLAVTNSSDGFASDAHWRHVRSRVSAISGTNAIPLAHPEGSGLDTFLYSRISIYRYVLRMVLAVHGNFQG